MYATKDDPPKHGALYSLLVVIQFVIKGWPEEKRFVAPCACPYFHCCDTLTVVDGILQLLLSEKQQVFHL